MTQLQSFEFYLLLKLIVYSRIPRMHIGSINVLDDQIYLTDMVIAFD